MVKKLTLHLITDARKESLDTKIREVTTRCFEKNYGNIFKTYFLVTERKLFYVRRFMYVEFTSYRYKAILGTRQ